jgi:signal recognition particle receptor subunit beta
MAEDLKIVFTGPVGVGKTTAIGAISDINPITTDETASDMASARKGHGHTTVALDYGLIELDAGNKVHLFGTPGQERFDFMWDILTRGGLGLILLMDNSRPNPFQDLRFFVNAFAEFIKRGPMVVGITKMDLQRTPAVPEYCEYLKGMGYRSVPVFEVDGRSKEDVKTLVMTLLFYLDPGIGE